MGEGGGQILRTALSLSLVTGKPFRIEKIRQGRKKPGIHWQHLTAIHAAAEIGKAEVEGAQLKSAAISFTPGKAVPGTYHFDIGTSGSTTLVLQTILPPLVLSSEPSMLVLEGGTHNPYAPSLDFLEKSFLPVLNRMGPQVAVTLERPGFYPRGGGRIKIAIEPVKKLNRLDLLERGPVRRCHAITVVAGLPRHIAERELSVIQRKLALSHGDLEIKELPAAYGPGNVVLIEIESQFVTEVFTGYGERGVRAETVAEKAAEEARHYLARQVPIGPYFADQLLIPLALAGEGSFKTLPLTLHATTHIEILKMFLKVSISTEQVGEEEWVVTIGKSASITPHAGHSLRGTL